MLLVRTRFTRYYLLIIILIAVYSLYAVPYQISGAAYNYGTIYFSGIVGGYSIISSLAGGISVSKSDQEFLLVSPINRKQLIIALLIVQAIGAGLILIAVSVFVLALVHYGPLEMSLVIVNLILLDIFLITIGIGTFHLKRNYRLIIAVAIGLWVISYFIGFPYSPQAFMEGYPLNSLIMTAPIAGASLLGAISSLTSEELPIRISSQRERKKEYNSILRYVKYSPVQAVFLNGFTNLSYSTNSMMAGGIKNMTSRIRLRTYYALIVAIAAVYGFLAYYLIDFGAQSEGFNLVVLLGSVYVGVMPQYIFNSGVMTYERAWLSFTSMEPWKYISIIIGSKVAQSVITSIPFVAVSIIDSYLGVKNSMEAVLVFLVLDPLLIGLYLLIVFSVSAYQITDEGFLSTRMSAMQFVPALPLMLFMIIVMLSIIVPLIVVFASIGTALLLGLLSTRREYWERRINKLVQKGYV